MQGIDHSHRTDRLSPGATWPFACLKNTDPTIWSALNITPYHVQQISQSAEDRMEADPPDAQIIGFFISWRELVAGS